MRTLSRRTRYALLLCVAALASMCTIAVAALQQGHGREMPKVISKVKSLEAVGVRLIREGGPNEALAITIRNNSDRPVVALSVESGDEKDTSGVCAEGFGRGDAPDTVVLEPYGTITMEMEAANLLPGKPLKISGVMFGDGTVDGERQATENMRDYKERAKKAPHPPN